MLRAAAPGLLAAMRRAHSALERSLGARGVLDVDALTGVRIRR